ncbi:MAG TPA: FAD-dependent oxidoreductase, partial [Polyangiaceae bacterium]|nr:FAD-dependent oxidoreductase [Polyangiaceae bacterium]
MMRFSVFPATPLPLALIDHDQGAATMIIQQGFRRWGHENALVGMLAGTLAVLPACGGGPARSASAQPNRPSAEPKANLTTSVRTTGPQRYDVIVVGAGMAGLTAGKTLKHAGRTVLLLEATDRIGGRGMTDTTTFSAPIDLGGAWIHGVETNPLSPIILGGGRAVHPTEVDASQHFFFNHRFATDCEKTRFGKITEAFELSLEESVHPGGPHAQPVDDAASNHLPKREPPGAECKRTRGGASAADATFEDLRSLVALNTGPLESATELEKNSTADATEFLAGHDVLLKKGYGTFVEEYGQEMRPDVRLGSPVTKIARGAGIVTVETSKGERFEGRKVLVTVSTGILRAGKIQFEPPLPREKLEAIDGLPMGLLDKVIMEFKTPNVFPKDNGASLTDAWVLYGGDIKNRDDDMAFVFSPMGTNIAIGFFGGERAW